MKLIFRGHDDRYAVEHLQGDELSYYYRVTD